MNLTGSNFVPLQTPSSLFPFRLEPQPDSELKVLEDIRP
jgi:hypothetical protein